MRQYQTEVDRMHKRTHTCMGEWREWLRLDTSLSWSCNRKEIEYDDKNRGDGSDGDGG